MTHYQETLRPQFHFTARRNWLNDPNGLVWHQGQYHLFFQYNPKGNNWGPNYWGHAVSTDLIHWHQLDEALEPDDYGWIWSGSAVVDRHNTSGLGKEGKPPLIAFYTTGNGKENLCVQSIAFSNDAGKTWTKYAGNPVLGHIAAQNRDPKVVWDENSSQWVMALYLEKTRFALFGSSDLLHWQELSRLEQYGDAECPDFFPMPLDGDSQQIKWVFSAANGKYQVGNFDGCKFIPETPVISNEFGRNFYAPQTWSNSPDGRRVQIAWMANGTYPGMPFNQQMSFPCELTLHSTPSGPRLHRMPVKEVESLRNKTYSFQDKEATVHFSDTCFYNPLNPNALAENSDMPCETADIEMEIDISQAKGFDLLLRRIPIRYQKESQELLCQCCAMELPLRNGRVTLRILLDKTSIEIYGNDGEASMSSCILPHPEAHDIVITPLGGKILVISLKIHKLNSAWCKT